LTPKAWRPRDQLVLQPYADELSKHAREGPLPPNLIPNAEYEYRQWAEKLILAHAYHLAECAIVARFAKFRNQYLDAPRWQRADLGERTITGWPNSKLDFPDYKPDEMFALAQHYGVPTRLLDWSIDPRAALYFAVAGAHKSNEQDAAVFALNTREVERNGAAHALNREMHLQVYAADNSGNPRAFAQRALFTYIQNAERRWLELEGFPAHEEVLFAQSALSAITKFVIPRELLLPMPNGFGWRGARRCICFRRTRPQRRKHAIGFRGDTSWTDGSDVKPIRIPVPPEPKRVPPSI
jgi:hypothetical protein